MTAQVAGHALALLVYPGGLLMAAAGLLAEAGAAWVLGPDRSPAPALRAPLTAARAVLSRVPALASLAGLMALLAATQLAIPFNPVPPAERNVLVAAGALAGASWLTWGWGWGRREADPALMLGVHACWLLAVLLPAASPENLRPQVLGAIVVPHLLPLKVACGALYLACLPPVLQLIPEAAPQGIPGAPSQHLSGEEAGFRLARTLLWLPYCGLFVSLFFPPATDDVGGLVRFAALTLGTAAAAAGLAANLTRRSPGATRALFRRLVLPFAGFTVAVALLTALFR